MANNNAAWITGAKASPFEIKPAPLGVPAENQILVKNGAIAINPVDAKIQHMAMFPLTYPTILGQDVAGEVEAVGPLVTRFKIGDRVLGTAVGFSTGRNEEKAFQKYTILQANMTSKMPDTISFQDAVVLPLGVSTAASALFHPDNFNLQLPTEPAQKPNGKTLLVWGGSSSVGSNAIQLAVAAGYDVIATASPKNFDYVRKLGASQVFDYRSPTVVLDLVHAYQGKKSIGAFDCIGGGAWATPIEFIQKIEGLKLVVTVTPGFPAIVGGVTVKQTQALSIRTNHVGNAIFGDFLLKALEAGTFIPAPKPLIVGTGLESLQQAVDLQHKGMSAQKAIVVL